MQARGFDDEYVDDLLLFGDDLAQLNDLGRRLFERAEALRLCFHAGAHARPVAEGIAFLGFVIWPTHRRLKRRNVVKAWRRVRRAIAAVATRELSRDGFESSLRGWLNHARYADSYGLRNAVTRSASGVLRLPRR